VIVRLQAGRSVIERYTGIQSVCAAY